MIKSFQENSALLMKYEWLWCYMTMYSFLINFEFPWIESIQIVLCSTLGLNTTPCLVCTFFPFGGSEYQN